MYIVHFNFNVELEKIKQVKGGVNVVLTYRKANFLLQEGGFPPMSCRVC